PGVPFLVTTGLDPVVHSDQQHEKLLGLHSGKPAARYALVWMTNDLVRRVYEHREGIDDGFTKEYSVKSLVYYEQHATAIGAIQREKNIKHWSRKWKIDLICSMNTDWRDLWEDITQLTRTAVICYLSAWTTGSSPVVTKGWGRRSCRLRIALRRGHLVCRDPRGLGQ